MSLELHLQTPLRQLSQKPKNLWTASCCIFAPGTVLKQPPKKHRTNRNNNTYKHYACKVFCCRLSGTNDPQTWGRVKLRLMAWTMHSGAASIVTASSTFVNTAGGQYSWHTDASRVLIKLCRVSRCTSKKKWAWQSFGNKRRLPHEFAHVLPRLKQHVYRVNCNRSLLTGIAQTNWCNILSIARCQLGCSIPDMGTVVMCLKVHNHGRWMNGNWFASISILFQSKVNAQGCKQMNTSGIYYTLMLSTTEKPMARMNIYMFNLYDCISCASFHNMVTNMFVFHQKPIEFKFKYFRIWIRNVMITSHFKTHWFTTTITQQFLIWIQ